MRTMKQADSSALAIGKKLAERIRVLAHDSKIILYGSSARGETDEFSDVDIYVELPDSCDRSLLETEINDIAWQIGFDNDRMIQTVVYRKSDVWETPRRSSPFIKAIHREGVPL